MDIEPDKIKIMIVEDHRLVRDGLRALLSTQAEIDIIGMAIHGADAIQFIRTGVKPNVVLMDQDMPVLSGLEALEIIKKEFLGIKVILLTMMNTKDLVVQAIQKGVDGFLYKNSSLDELVKAITLVHSGEKYFTSEVTMALAKTQKADDPLLAKLSIREQEILQMVAKGLSSTEIGTQLFISPRTVDTHRNNIIQKLEVHGIAGLTEFALRRNLI